jgi:PAS domain S-box-containing protein
MMDQKLDSRYFPLLLDAVDQGVFTVDRSGCITSFNRAAESITGYGEGDVLGRECSGVFQSDLCQTLCPLRHSIASGAEIRNREVRVKTKDGRLIPISISTSPLKTPGGNLLGGVEVFRDLSHVVDLRRRLDSLYQFQDIVSRNPRMQAIFQLLPSVAESGSTILITGPSGSGKELLAKAIHSHGPRRRKPFIAVNCAAIPETLLESELFGYRRGAFTDARRDRLGRIAQAEGGTLFLDEVGDLPTVMQVKLLRFLQDKCYEPLGSSAPIRADVRLVAATHQDLETLVARGHFRDDLYYRLNVLQIALPPLCERAEDIPLLARHFVQRYRLGTGKSIEGFSEEAMAALVRYDFPGNIRELENLVERAFILCEGPLIGVDQLPPRVVLGVSRPGALPGGCDLDSVERRAVQEALAKHGGNRSRAARDLGVHRTTLIRKIRRFGMEAEARPDAPGSGSAAHSAPVR